MCYVHESPRVGLFPFRRPLPCGCAILLLSSLAPAAAMQLTGDQTGRGIPFCRSWLFSSAVKLDGYLPKGRIVWDWHLFIYEINVKDNNRSEKS
jgi:hypothetical protein